MSTLTIRSQHENERNQDATVYIGNLDERVDDPLIWELMLQAGPLVHVHLPRDRVNGQTQGFGFAEFVHESDADYASNIMNQIRLFGKPIRVNKASADKQRNLDVGAELFVGNLDPLVDEKVLLDTFSGFGNLVSPPKVARNELGESRGFGFVSYDDFDASDRALESMNGQFLMNRPCTVAYAFKRDGKGERHGDPAERLLAQQAKKNNYAFPRPPPIQQQQQQLPSASAAPTPGLVIPPPPLPTTGLGGGAPPLGYPSQQPLNPQPSMFNQYAPPFTTTTPGAVPPPPPPGFSSANVVVPAQQQPPSLPPGFSTAHQSPYGTPTPPPGAPPR